MLAFKPLQPDIPPRPAARVKATKSQLRESGLDPARWSDFTFHEGRGCIDCNGTGYRGRTAIAELLDMSDRIRQMILQRRPGADIKRAAKEEGMTFLREAARDGWERPHDIEFGAVDVTELESLRQFMNSRKGARQPNLTYLPFIVAALTRVLEGFPQCNATYDEERGVIVRHRAVHVGVATQTPDGLKVPVVRNAEALPLYDLAAEIGRLSEAARSNKARKDELGGSTITVTSLGKLGGIASTPVINAPEVAIIGINKAVDRPVVVEGAVTVRRMMNLSSSFDHRFVDGFDAAAMIQSLREYLEHPATIFIQD